MESLLTYYKTNMKCHLATFILFIFSIATQAQVAQPGRAGWQTDTYSNCKIWNPIPQTGETVEWFGECKNGYAEGSGQLTWKFSTGNEVWNVNMAAGKPGSGPYRIATTHNGTVSTWTGTFVSGIKTGVNVRKFSDGTEFEGTWVNGQVNGIGTFKAIDGKKQKVYVVNGCIWSAQVGGLFINSVDKNKNQCLSERGTSSVSATVPTTNNTQPNSNPIPNRNGSSMCNEKISQLNSDLQSILRKTPAMPPLTQIYIPLRDLYEQAKMARDVGNYSECVNMAESALNHSRAYAR